MLRYADEESFLSIWLRTKRHEIMREREENKMGAILLHDCTSIFEKLWI